MLQILRSMPKFDPAKPRDSATFQCRPCKWTFDTADFRTEAAPELEAHPFRYFAECPICHQEVEQAAWERALQKAWQNATGPRTEEGKAATAANLDGHPTPDETKRTRFNAMKHGLHARVANYFPAKPDGYSFCSACEVEREWCANQPACVKKTEIFMLHQAAFEQRDPKHLAGVYSDLQSAIFAVLQQILQTIIADGVKIVAPQYSTDAKGEVIIAEYFDDKGQRKVIYDIEAHPLFKPLGELLSRTGLTLTDMGMTSKVIESRDDAELGNLKDKAPPEEANAFRERQMKALEGLGSLVERARRSTERDPVLIEHNAEAGEGT